MEFVQITNERFNDLKSLHTAYKVEMTTETHNSFL